jgi:hydrogenase expression/formation protein HypC
VVEVAGTTALVSVEGALREVDVSLVDGVRVGGYVLVHAGFALECWDERDVREWKAILEGTWLNDSRPVDPGSSEVL